MGAFALDDRGLAGIDHTATPWDRPTPEELREDAFAPAALEVERLLDAGDLDDLAMLFVMLDGDRDELLAAALREGLAREKEAGHDGPASKLFKRLAYAQADVLVLER